ncbi:hypothetical protein F0562_008596 [Nyssa sinensis]|uniref:CCT domain-containing protein n=1 Tax=Nyssa sinensis TaxID=561372 RepID=A0A5J5A7W9_9ASTE|nr:hypothetical protein F0562_008596 [Nyssa sinensis]
MASIPPYYSDYLFSNEFCEFPAPVAGGHGGAAVMCCEESLPFFDHGALDLVPPEPDVKSSFSMTSFPEQFGVSDMVVPALPEFYLGWSDNVGCQSFGARYQSGVCEFREERNGVVPEYFPAVYPVAGDNWGIQGKQVPAIEEPTMKVGRYSVEERKDRILRYLKKRNRRNFNKTIKYACRKTLADKRVRVRGRFARNNELCEEEAIMKKKNNPHQEREFYNDTFQMKHEEEDWLHEAIASLMYLPYISG